jgi:hypothetical protein
MTKMMKLTLAALVAAFALTTTAGAAVVVNRVPPPKTSTPATPAGPAQPVGTNSTFSDFDCTLEMGQLRLIRPVQLDEAAYDGIFVQPVCEGEQGAAARNAGNAAGLRPVLATKADVIEALAAQDYITDEVVGVRFGGGDTLVLYVHHVR